MFSKATSIVHHWLTSHVREGDLAVDATCGNGHDTVVLARLVGSSGQVIAFDVQEKAIENTRNRLEEAGIQDRVVLHHASHERVDDVLVESSVNCAVFNLGYLPGADKTLVTTPESTLAAHQFLLDRLAAGGAIITTVYTGHPGGKEEAAALHAWAQGLDGKQVTVARHEWVNLDGDPPHVLIIHRRPRSSS